MGESRGGEESVVLPTAMSSAAFLCRPFGLMGKICTLILAEVGSAFLPERAAGILHITGPAVALKAIGLLSFQCQTSVCAKMAGCRTRVSLALSVGSVLTCVNQSTAVE